jgi:tRNA (guanine-N7-)-methyltransferase
MKPEDLKSPFRWNERCVMIKDRILYVPDYYDRYEEFTFPGWAAIFNNDRPVRLEFCSGNGAWIAAKAAAEPEINWVAVEMQFCRVRKIGSKVINLNLDNLFIICGEAYNATHRYLPSDSIDQVFINFPDPWPKKRHAKHRLIQPRFLDQLQRILKIDHAVTFVTDDPDYSELTIDEFSRHPGFASGYPAPCYLTELPGYGVTSFFEDLWRQKGKMIRYHRFVKK